eukprot:scaffold216901_cov28-Tisochrysis_lutea.AAC.1
MTSRKAEASPHSEWGSIDSIDGEYKHTCAQLEGAHRSVCNVLPEDEVFEVLGSVGSPRKAEHDDAILSEGQIEDEVVCNRLVTHHELPQRGARQTLLVFHLAHQFVRTLEKLLDLLSR